jgi:hypothetical protein
MVYHVVSIRTPEAPGEGLGSRGQFPLLGSDRGKWTRGEPNESLCQALLALAVLVIALKPRPGVVDASIGKGEDSSLGPRDFVCHDNDESLPWMKKDQGEHCW